MYVLIRTLGEREICQRGMDAGVLHKGRQNSQNDGV